MPFVQREQTWTDAPAAPPADRLVVRAANVASATVDARRARLSCAPALDVTSDGPLDLRIDCAPLKRACAATVRVRLPRVRGERTVAVAGRHVRRAHGRNLRRAVIRRPSRRAFTVRIRMRTSNGRTVVVKRRVASCARTAAAR
jgi:ribosomal protein L34